MSDVETTSGFAAGEDAVGGLDSTDGTVSTETDGPAGLSELPHGSANLEEEGDIAADYIEELLDICDLDGDIDIATRGGRAYLSVNATGDSNIRVLSKPDTVNALQELTRLAVQTKTGAFSRLILDVGGSREARQGELAQLVDDAVARITLDSPTADLPAMSSYERKIVHDIVAERGLVSASVGEGRDRHTVISNA
jgi:spoIIIJ-associated protein